MASLVLIKYPLKITHVMKTTEIKIKKIRLVCENILFLFLCSFIKTCFPNHLTEQKLYNHRNYSYRISLTIVISSEPSFYGSTALNFSTLKNNKY